MQMCQGEQNSRKTQNMKENFIISLLYKECFGLFQLFGIADE